MRDARRVEEEAVPATEGFSLSRRGFLKVGGAWLAGLVLLGAAGCGGGTGDGEQEGNDEGQEDGEGQDGGEDEDD